MVMHVHSIAERSMKDLRFFRLCSIGSGARRVTTAGPAPSVDDPCAAAVVPSGGVCAEADEAAACWELEDASATNAPAPSAPLALLGAEEDRIEGGIVRGAARLVAPDRDIKVLCLKVRFRAPKTA